MVLEEAGSFMAERGINTTHTPGQKLTRIIFDMLYYFLFYLSVFFFVVFIGEVSKRCFSSLKISIFSLSTSIILLLVWNFFLGPMLMKESYGGVPTVLSSMLSVAILFFFSVLMCVLHYALKRMLK